MSRKLITMAGDILNFDADRHNAASACWGSAALVKSSAKLGTRVQQS
jgi:hypothetical protein